MEHILVCRYVLCKFFFITVSRFSLSLAATIACITFAALQLTSLFLITTPPESAASAFRWFATPLRLFGVKLDTLTFQLLLSLRCVSLVRCSYSSALLLKLLQFSASNAEDQSYNLKSSVPAETYDLDTILTYSASVASDHAGVTFCPLSK